MSDCQHLTATATFYEQALTVCDFNQGQLTEVQVDQGTSPIERIDIDCRDCGTSMTYESVADAPAHIQAVYGKRMEFLRLNKLFEHQQSFVVPSQSPGKRYSYLTPLMSLFSSLVLSPLLTGASRPSDGASYPSLEVIDQIVTAYESDEHIEWSIRTEYSPFHDRIRSDLLPAWRKAKGNFFTTLGWVTSQFGSFEASWLADQSQALAEAQRQAEWLQAADTSIGAWYVAGWMNSWRDRAGQQSGGGISNTK